MSIKKIKLMIDGNFIFHIHEYLKECHNKYIDWVAFMKYIEYEVSKRENQSIPCLIDDPKCFFGTKIVSDDGNRDFLYKQMEFAKIIKHAWPLKTSDGGCGLKEDAVDVALAVDAIADYHRAREEDKYSYFFLLAGDSDFVPLIQKLKGYGVKTFLIYIDFSNGGRTTKTAQRLLEEVDDTIKLRDIIDERVETIKKNVLKCYGSNTSLDTSIISNYTNNTISNNNINISWDVIQAAMDKCHHLENGYVLGAELGVQIAKELQVSKLPAKLRTILDAYSDKLDIVINQYGGGEFKVRLKPGVFLKKILIRKRGIAL